MPGHDHLDLHFFGPGHCRVEVVNLKPEKDAISIGFVIWITDRTVMVLHLPLVQLKDQPTIQDQAFILRTAMRTLTAKQALIPLAAQFDIAHANQRLCTHRGLLLVYCFDLPERAASFRLVTGFGAVTIGNSPRGQGWQPGVRLNS